MDTKLQYHVWMRNGNEWAAVTKIPVSELTAETLAAMMAQERKVPHEDYRFAVSTSKPGSIGFSGGEHAINGCVIDADADKAIRHAVKFERNIDTFQPGISRFALLQQAGLVSGNGWVTEAAIDYVAKHPKPIA